MSTDKRVVRNQISTQAARTILRSIASSPEQYVEDDNIKKAIKSQGGLAKLKYEGQIDDKTISKDPMSLNTLKTYSDELFEGGFEGLNHLRLKAIEAMEEYAQRSIRPNSQSRAGLKAKIHELEDELEKHRSVNFILLQAISSGMSTIRSMQDAPDEAVRELRSKEGLERIRAIASLNPYPFDKPSPSVISLKDYKDGR